MASRQPHPNHHAWIPSRDRGRRAGAAIEMIAADHDGRFQLAFGYQIIQREAKLVALAIAEPADSCRISLEADALLRQLDPARQHFIVREHFEHELIGAMDVRRFARERGPPKWPASLAEQRADIGRHKAWKIVSVLHALLERECPDVISVIKRD